MKKVWKAFLSLSMAFVILCLDMGEIVYASEESSQQVVEQQAAEQQAAEQQVAEQQAAEQQAAEQQVAEQQAAEQQVAEQQAAEQQAIVKDLKKEDFDVYSSIDYENENININIKTKEVLQHYKIKEVCIDIQKESTGETLKKYSLERKTDEEFFLNVGIGDIFQENLEARPIVYAETITSKNANENTQVDNQEIELDKIYISYEGKEQLEDEKKPEEEIRDVNEAVSDSGNKIIDGEEDVIQDEEKKEKNNLENEIEVSEDHKIKNLQIIDIDGKQQKFRCEISAVGFQKIQIAVWSEENGQDDIQWYNAQKENDIYIREIVIKDFKSLGKYKVHVYGIKESGETSFLDGTTFLVDKPTVKDMHIEDTPTGFVITAGGITSPAGIEKISVGIWSEPGQSDIKWKEMQKIDNQYRLEIDAIEHGILNGIYQIHLYAVDGNGFTNIVGVLTHKVKLSDNSLVIKNNDNKQNEFTLALDTTEYTDVSFAVWSEINGQDDIQWYLGERLGNLFSTKVRVKNHGATGKYFVHVYGKKQGKTICISTGTFEVEKPVVENYSINKTQKGFKVDFNVTEPPAGVKKVEAGIWSSEDQSDLEWITLAPQNNNYELEVDVENHKGLMGTYRIHLYVEDGNEITSFCGGFTYDLSITVEKMNVDVVQEMCDITLENISPLSAVKGISIAIWSGKNGQDDIRWYNARRNGNTYGLSIPQNDLHDGGIYYVHAYALTASGTNIFIGGKTFEISSVIEVGDASNGELPIFISEGEQLQDFKGFDIEVWARDDKSDLLRTFIEKNKLNEYNIQIPLSRFELYSGDYHIMIYRKFTDGNREVVAEKIKKLQFNKGILSQANISDNKMYCSYEITDIDLLGVDSQVSVGVWSEKNNQADLKWYIAEKTKSGYKINIPVYEFGVTGTYYVHFYVDLKNGKSLFLNGSTFEVNQIVTTSLEVRNINKNKGTASLVENIGISDDIKEVSVGIWNINFGNAVVWYEMKPVSKYEFIAEFNVKNHNYEFGTYNAHVYGKDSNGNSKIISATSFSIQPDNMIVCQEIDQYSVIVKIFGANVEGKPVDSVSMGTWTMEGNQDDIKWNSAQRDTSGAYSVKIDSINFKRNGTYMTHIYGKSNSKEKFLGGISYNLIKKNEFDEYAQSVMHNIIFAVETGGQVYGRAQYDCFSPAYNLSSKETAITIGAAGWFATEAQRLLRLIREEDPLMFAALDTQGISRDIDNENWLYYGGDRNGHATILKGSEKAKCIQRLISTNAGIKVQNRLVDEQMIKYVNEAKSLGVVDLKARMFCANVRHLGGYGAMKRVIEWCKEDKVPLTMENIYTSMREHTTDKNGNGVGANKYNTRHKKVMNWINMYIQ